MSRLFLTMKNLEDKIIDFLEGRKKGKRKFSDIQKGLGLTEEDTTTLSMCISQMEKDGLLFLDGNHQYQTRKQAGIVQGKISISLSNQGYLDLEDDTTILINEDNQRGAMHGDIVLVKCSKDKKTGEVVRVLKRSKEHLLATYYAKGNSFHLVLDDEKLQGKPLKVIENPNIQLIDGLKVITTIKEYDRPLTVIVEKEIGHKDDPGVDILSILYEYDIEPEFPQEVIDEANAIPTSVLEEELKGRIDLRNEMIITIDGDGSKDFDDAVSVVKNEDGSYLLKVSIADVSHYVKESSPLDIEARKRGTSTYVTDRVVPMLPHILSNGICSLNPKVDRLTITCEMVVSKDGEIIDSKIYPSVMCSCERMTYNNVNKILDGDKELNEKYKHLGTLLFDLADCADAIRRTRVKKGAIEFASSEAEITVDADGVPIDVQPVVRGHGERIIEDLMIAANVIVASFLKWQNIPCIYRVHEKPMAKKIQQFIGVSEAMGHKLIVGKNELYPTEIQSYLDNIKETPEYPVLSKMLLRCMQKAKYDNTCIGHFGLAENEYLHFTSPIRRYPDLIVHRMLRKYSFEMCMDEEERRTDEGKCKEYAESSSQRERASQDAEYACDDMKKAEYMQSHIGEVFDGMITSVQSFGFYVALENTIEGLVRIKDLQDDYYVFDSYRNQLVGEATGKRYTLGTKVKVEVVSANKEARCVDFTLVK